MRVLSVGARLRGGSCARFGPGKRRAPILTFLLLVVCLGLPAPGFGRTLLGAGAEWSSFSPADDWQFVSGDFDADGSPDVAGYHPSNGSVWVGLNQLPATSGFALANWGSVSPASGWTFAAGEFGGDARVDLVAYHSSGEVWVGINSGGSFSFSQWASASLPAVSDVVSLSVGDFDGDGQPDLALYRSGHTTGECPDVLQYTPDATGSTFSPQQGQVWQGLRQSGTSAFDFSCVLVVEDPVEWEFVAADVASPWFEVQEFGQSRGSEALAPNADELVGYDPSTGIVQVFVPHVHTDTSSHLPGYPTEGLMSTRSQDLNGDGLVDGWYEMTPASGWQLTAGRVAQNKFDALDDVVLHHREQAKVWVGISGGGQPACKGDDDFWWTCFRYWAETDYCEPTAFGTPPFCAASGGGLPGADSGVLAAPFAGGSADDLVRYDATSGKLVLLENLGPTGIGYAWPQSATNGATIDFYVSSTDRISPHTVDFYRHVSFGRDVDSTWMATATYTPGVQDIDAASWRVGAGWEVSHTLTVPGDWPSGLYSAIFSATFSDVDAHVPFVVRPSGPDLTRAAVLANTNTWMAYNDWGGSSKYSSGTPLSFFRPNFRASPLAENLSGHHLARAELWILGWLEREGFGVDLYSDLDFHEGVVDFSEYTTLIVGTHPEYWTDGMYDRLDAFLDGGGALLYLGGNGIFERGGYTTDAVGAIDGMAFLGDIVPEASSVHRRYATFRMAFDPDTGAPISTRPELPLLGAATEACGVEPRGFQVLSPLDSLFDGVAMGLGALFGATGWNTGGGKWVGTEHAGVLHAGTPADGGASGFEVDTHAGPGATGMPRNCGSMWPESGVSTLPAPAGVTVLARGYLDAGTPYEAGELSYYEHPSGGLVLSAGSITFGGSLVVDPVLDQLMKNALERTLAVPEPPNAVGVLVGAAVLGLLGARRRSLRLD
ncbi:MAG: hypothetical protein CL933_00345 [Deltaproteobacteria bacterium]|nr:hypothetical protein [Deltaproteobacteria bacterium]